MSSSEFSEWKEFDKLNPIGDLKHEILIGQLISTIVNLVKTKEARPITLKDVMNDWFNEWTKEEGDAHSLLRTAYALHLAFGGKADETIEKMINVN